MYADAIDWVLLPAVLGMSQHGDGGIIGSKPYATCGNYISRMSEYCRGCPFDPCKGTGEDASPLTMLYCGFLGRHGSKLRGDRWMILQRRNLDRKDAGERGAIHKRAKPLRGTLTASTCPVTSLTDSRSAMRYGPPSPAPNPKLGSWSASSEMPLRTRREGP